MADNVNLAALTGNAAADEVSYSGDTALVQLMRLVGVTGSEGAKTVVPVEVTSDGYLVVRPRRDVVRMSAASSGLTTSSPTYTAGDTLGALFTLANAARVSGGTGVITGVQVIDASDVLGPVDVVFFRASVTLAADNAAFAISDTDALSVVGIAQLTTLDIGNNRIAQAYNLAIPYDCDGGTSLYAALITRTANAVFGATSALQLNVFAERD